jgi:iron complex outermembrane receptor protein
MNHTTVTKVVGVFVRFSCAPLQQKVSSHIGMEFLLNYQLLQTSQFKLSSYFSAAVNRFTFKDFDGDNDYSEINSLAFPMHNGTGLDASSTSGFSLTTSFGKVGRINE